MLAGTGLILRGAVLQLVNALHGTQPPQRRGCQGHCALEPEPDQNSLLAWRWHASSRVGKGGIDQSGTSIHQINVPGGCRV
jgi:hypothetical protein